MLAFREAHDSISFSHRATTRPAINFISDKQKLIDAVVHHGLCICQKREGGREGGIKGGVGVDKTRMDDKA